ncbi:MAG TPA: hypothetical protein VN915_06540 [Elusimicrobiota bacterium]|nr:hypothetical protein [Elusimicrobiota bacterium]
MTNGTSLFIAVCLGVIALEMTLVLIALAVLVLRVSRAVRAVERVVLQVEDKFASIRTSWMRVLQGAGGVLGGFMSGRKHARERERARERASSGDGARFARR